MTRYLIAATLALVACYGLVEGWPLIEGPTLAIASPAQGASVERGVVSVAGSVGHAATLTLDGAPLLADQDGRFSETLAFASGATILTFVATDRFGRTITKTRTIFVP